MSSKHKKPLAKRLKWFFYKRNFLYSMFALTLFFEYLDARFNIDVSTFILTIVIGVFLTDLGKILFEGIVQSHPDSKKKSSENQNSSKQDGTTQTEKRCTFQSILDNAYNYLLHCIILFKNSGLTALLIVCVMFLGVPAVAAHYNVCGRIINEVSLIQYSEPASEVETKTETNTIAPSEPSLTPDIEHTEIPNAPSSVVSKPQGFLADPSRYYQLSIEEYNKLYFLSGPFVITDWTNMGEVCLVLTEFLDNLKSQNRLNSFDSNASTSLQNDVYYASQLEAKMCDSQDLDYIIEVRTTAWSQYPKHSLATLLASNYQRYALEYYKISGSYETIEYYYAQSTFWLFESLAFSNVGNYTTKNTLSMIKMRYHDIASVAPKNSHSKYYATILFDAFESLENSYV